MLPYFLLLVISSAFANSIVNQNDPCSYLFEGKKYCRSSVLTIKGLPTNLVYNPVNNDLLFTLIDLDTLQNDDEQTKMDQYLLKDGETIKIDNVNGQAAAVDAKHDRVYIASDTGLNVLNRTNKANFLSFKNEDIVQLYQPANKDYLYAVFFPENEVYKIDVEKNIKTKIDNIPCAFILAVDSNDNIFYECDSKYVKVLLKDFEEPIEFVGIGKNMARAVTVDNRDRVILAANDGLYHLKPDNLIPRKLMNLEFIPSGIAVHDNEIYLASNGVIFKFREEK